MFFLLLKLLRDLFVVIWVTILNWKHLELVKIEIGLTLACVMISTIRLPKCFLAINDALTLFERVWGINGALFFRIDTQHSTQNRCWVADIDFMFHIKINTPGLNHILILVSFGFKSSTEFADALKIRCELFRLTLIFLRVKCNLYVSTLGMILNIVSLHAYSSLINQFWSILTYKRRLMRYHSIS